MADRAMMEEVLELLASDSPDHTSAESTTVSSASGSNHTSLVSDLNHGSASGDNGNDTGTQSGSQRTTDPRTDDRLEEKYPADYRTVQIQGEGAALQQSSISDSNTPFARRATPSAVQGPWAPQPLLFHPPPFFPLNPPPLAESPVPVQATTSVAISVPPVGFIGSRAPRTRSRSWRASPPRPFLPSTMSNVLPTGQRVKVRNSAEFDELRRKLRMQTASRRYRKRKKAEARQQKSKILELQAELTRLQDLETQMKQYQQRPIASLEEELQMHHDEISDLSQKFENAAREELDWIKLMSGNLRK